MEVPVIILINLSLLEFVENAVVTSDPSDTDFLTLNISDINKHSFKIRICNKSLNGTKMFSWEKLQRTWKIYEEF